jgi:hypothetical protein
MSLPAGANPPARPQFTGRRGNDATGLPGVSESNRSHLHWLQIVPTQQTHTLPTQLIQRFNHDWLIRSQRRQSLK